MGGSDKGVRGSLSEPIGLFTLTHTAMSTFSTQTRQGTRGGSEQGGNRVPVGTDWALYYYSYCDVHFFQRCRPGQTPVRGSEKEFQRAKDKTQDALDVCLIPRLRATSRGVLQL